MVKMGLIGCGKWGENHARVLSEIGCDFVGIADRNPAVKKFADSLGVKFEPDYKKLLQFVDAVSVVVPTDKHYEVVKECLLAGKHVFVEKPITPDSKSAMELIELAKKKKLILAVGYLFRYNSALLELKKQLKNAGDIHYITARYVHSNKPPRTDSGVILNFATHLIDIMGFLFGDLRPRKVFCKKVNYLSGEREDAAFITLDYGSFIANLEVTWFHPLKKRDMWIIGSKEKIYADLLEQMLVRYPIRLEGGNVVSEKEINVEIRKNEPLKEELSNFCRNVERGKVDGAEREYDITKICEKCLESAKSGKEIELNL
jgi:predicted dehydrogenase